MMDQHNPFTERAQRARAMYNRLSGTSTHDKAMADAFPLGAGFGRGRNRGKHLDARISRATKAIAALKEAEWWESNEKAFADGRIDARGRSINPASIARSEKRYAAKEKREARIAAARAAVAGKQPWEYSAETWADACGYLAGGARRLVMADHADRIRARAGEAA